MKKFFYVFTILSLLGIIGLTLCSYLEVIELVGIFKKAQITAIVLFIADSWLLQQILYVVSSTRNYANKSSNLTSFCTIPECALVLIPNVVTIVRCTAFRVLVAFINADFLFRSFVRIRDQWHTPIKSTSSRKIKIRIAVICP